MLNFLCVFYVFNCYVHVIPLVTLSFVANVSVFKTNVKQSFILSYAILSCCNGVTVYTGAATGNNVINQLNAAFMMSFSPFKLYNIR